MDTAALRAAVRAIAPITDDEMVIFESLTVQRRLAHRETLVDIGQVCNWIGFVLNGSLRGYYLHEGEEIHLDFFFEGSFVTSYRSFLTRTPSRLRVEALQECDLLVFSHQTVQEGYRRSHQWERFGRLVCEYIYTAAQDRIERLLLDTPEERYLRLLGEHPDIFERVALNRIASYLGITPPSLSRIRRRIASRSR